jgi:hypothetical protein
VKKAAGEADSGFRDKRLTMSPGARWHHRRRFVSRRCSPAGTGARLKGKSSGELVAAASLGRRTALEEAAARGCFGRAGIWRVSGMGGRAAAKIGG